MSLLRARYDGLLADLDGVVYVGPDAVPGAIEALMGARAAGIRTAYVTNNANRPAAQVAAHLRELSLELDDGDVVTSAQIAAGLVRQRFGTGARVLAVGGPGVALALRAEGLDPVDPGAGRPIDGTPGPGADESVVAVVQGYGPGVGWVQLAEAAFAIQAGAHWVATNTDRTIPQSRGIAPGNGTLVDAVRAAVDVDPEVAGKPQAVAFGAAAERLGSARPLVLGDRLDTDIEGANAAGFDSLLVLTGVHGYAELAAAPAAQRPTFVAEDLGALAEPAPAVQTNETWASSGTARVDERDGVLRLVSGSTRIDALRAALALVWPATDAGRHVRLDDALAALLAGRVVGGGE